ncbi:nucleotidyltransferase domain-containing protein [Clostridium sp.]|uniref:type VII toxin-antitoxin system MntA family adenylyltransferase antitoxin n=1 Tax=Clostridium sp. TaxID=1506 RepID=UPI0026210E53|nr:nucleotidyltransferase domain-containing protein [Clostridium sp.]
MFKEDYVLNFDNKEVIQKIKDYLYNREDVAVAYLFGSFDTEDFNSSSDIDIAILPMKDLSYSECLHMNSELEDLIEFPIDLNNIEALPEYIQIQILMRNNQLFCKDDLLEQKFLDKVNFWIKTEFPLWKKLMLDK